MKNKLLIAISAIALSLSFACAKKDASLVNTNKGDLKDLPAWVLDPAVKEGVAAVGIASPSKGGIKFQIPKAELDAKANIAATIQSEISRITKDSLRSARINEQDDVEEFFAQATKEVVKNLPLSGVKRLNIFKGEDGTLYVHMMLGNEDYSKFLENSQKTFDARLAKANFGRENINKAEAATKELFKELEEEREKESKPRGM
ncbi:MAG: hypothetical protein A2887_02300 [Alphaproteobacteria bacterium RIFCSPLOWO2_01_FULL_40_26]|nr:MAG: hypothetical protein A3D15_03070 [Alphaproteobacteria bacterium RIFCSPHIGHO2_02_FULL_40_34]OFW94820.1 MAG: hypothetical protein A2887_02300 [Alphaproteobacteria bacterium RIFCSPLOWO2_01_FULL_40_26]OFX10446.1 MAG: hypothetical protein A3H30_03710 [Alphaproteobacteria bacterium RIFCSPLOWO2_02_FULL_40_19]OFX11020.1 MAG: hypothetical protein A3G22_01160 [Alphaproteobacteria bacterium RIFCSPLOWO2_12_FULL_40_11]